MNLGIFSYLKDKFKAEDNRTLVKNIFYSFFLYGSRYILQFIQFAYLWRVIEPEKYGLLGWGTSFVIYFDIIIETALGVENIESIAKASPRTAHMNIGQGDLSVSMGFPRFIELNFEQYFYAENRLLYAARAAKVQAHSLGAQNGVDFTDISMGEEAMLKACRHAQWMGFMGASIIHPGWVNAVNEGFKPPQKDLDMARKVKAALDEAYAQGKGSVTVDGRMYDVANMKHVNYILARAEAIARREAEKAAALNAVKGV